MLRLWILHRDKKPRKVLKHRGDRSTLLYATRSLQHFVKKGAQAEMEAGRQHHAMTGRRIPCDRK